MRALVTFIFFCLSVSVQSETLVNLVTVEDGLSAQPNTTKPDDYIRLTLLEPSYQTAAAIKVVIEDWLGPNMVILEDSVTIKIQAPRDSTERIIFLDALLKKDIE